MYVSSATIKNFVNNQYGWQRICEHLYSNKRKSENMFSKLKSNESDFSFESLMAYLDIMNKNILYITHSTDKCLLVLKKLENDTGLQKQVDSYFEDSAQEEVEDEK